MSRRADDELSEAFLLHDEGGDKWHQGGRLMVFQEPQQIHLISADDCV